MLNDDGVPSKCLEIDWMKNQHNDLRCLLWYIRSKIIPLFYSHSTFLFFFFFFFFIIQYLSYRILCKIIILSLAVCYGWCSIYLRMFSYLFFLYLILSLKEAEKEEVISFPFLMVVLHKICVLVLNAFDFVRFSFIHFGGKR